MHKPEAHAKMTVPATVEELDRIRGFVQQYGEQVLAPGLLDDLVLAVDEAVANVVEHAYEGSAVPVSGQLIRIEAAVYADRYAVSVMDRGAAFDPASLPPVDLEAHFRAARKDGLGVHMIRRLVDRWEYVAAGQPAGGWNRLTLIKYLPAGGTPSA